MTLKAAMTKEEWVRKEAPGNGALLRGFDDNDGGVILEAYTVYDKETPIVLELPIVWGESAYRYPITNRHGAAALCLHEQPFGFTRKDVKTLRAADPAFGDCGILHAIADRIEALLPPENAA